jgi:hypothetical protein
MDHWHSPRLGIRFELTESTLNIYDHQGNLFLSPLELRKSLEQEKARADQEKARAEQEKARADCLAAKLKELGINPDTLIP